MQTHFFIKVEMTSSGHWVLSWLLPAKGVSSEVVNIEYFARNEHNSVLKRISERVDEFFFSIFSIDIRKSYDDKRGVSSSKDLADQDSGEQTT